MRINGCRKQAKPGPARLSGRFAAMHAFYATNYSACATDHRGRAANTTQRRSGPSYSVNVAAKAGLLPSCYHRPLARYLLVRVRARLAAHTKHAWNTQEKARPRTMNVNESEPLI